MNLFPEDSVDLVNDNYISSSSLYSNTKFIVPPNEQEDATKYAFNAYAELFPIFMETIQHLQSHGQPEDNRVKSLLTSELNHLRMNSVSKSNRKEPQGSFVSCHTNHVKRRKTHGTNYYKK